MLSYSVSVNHLFLCIAAFTEVTESRERGELMFFSSDMSGCLYRLQSYAPVY